MSRRHIRQQNQKNVTQLNATIYRYLAESEQIGIKQEQAAEPAKKSTIFKPRTLQHEATINEFGKMGLL